MLALMVFSISNLQICTFLNKYVRSGRFGALQAWSVRGVRCLEVCSVCLTFFRFCSRKTWKSVFIFCESVYSVLSVCFYVSGVVQRLGARAELHCIRTKALWTVQFYCDRVQQTRLCEQPVWVRPNSTLRWVPHLLYIYSLSQMLSQKWLSN